MVRLEDSGYSHLHVASSIDNEKFELDEIPCGSIAIVTDVTRKSAIQVMLDGKIRYINPAQCVEI